jgi:hypothetical protein
MGIITNTIIVLTVYTVLVIGYAIVKEIVKIWKFNKKLKELKEE